MDPHYSAGSGSTAAIRRHPLHPMLVPLPIGMLVSALIADVVFAVNREPFWADAAYWLLVGGLLTGGLAGIFGLIEFKASSRARALVIGWVHGVGNIVAMLVLALNVYLRWDDHVGSVMPTGLILSITVIAIIGVSGWLGGELSYRHGVGVAKSIGAPSKIARRW